MSKLRLFCILYLCLYLRTPLDICNRLNSVEEEIWSKHNPGSCECDIIWKQGLCRCNSVRLSPKSNDLMIGVLIRKRRGRFGTQRHGREGHGKTETDVAVKQLAKECQGLVGATRSWEERNSPASASDMNQPQPSAL